MTIIDSGKHKSTSQGSRCVNRKILASGTHSVEPLVCHSANVQDTFFERQCLVENSTEAANRVRNGNIDARETDLISQCLCRRDLSKGRSRVRLYIYI